MVPGHCVGEEKARWCVLSLLCFGLEGTHATSALSPLAEHENLIIRDREMWRGGLQNVGEHLSLSQSTVLVMKHFFAPFIPHLYSPPA